MEVCPISSTGTDIRITAADRIRDFIFFMTDIFIVKYLAFTGHQNINHLYATKIV